MEIFSKIIKYILLLTIFNTFLSLELDPNLQENEIIINLEIKSKNSETTDFEESKFSDDEEIKNITISSQKFQRVIITCNNNTKVNLLLFIYKGNKGSLNYSGYSDNLKDISNSNNLIQYEINTTNIKNKLDINININISSDSNEGIVQIFKVINNNYKNITEKDNEKIKINSKNFIKFLTEKDTRIKVDINFNKEIDDEISYGFISLPTNNTQYLPTSFSFNKIYEEIKKESIKNKTKIKIQEEIKEKNDRYGMQYFAFIFSIKNNNDYDITINHDEIMDYFLIASIALALIFAVITFFLIRIKQPNTKNDDFYEEKREEDEEDT